MCKLTVYSQDSVLQIECAERTRLSDILAKASFYMPCGGCRRCGKCLVYTRGELSGISQQETALIRHSYGEPSMEGFSPRLACFCEIYGDSEIHIPASKSDAPQMAETQPLRSSYDGSGMHALGIAADIGTTTITLRLFHLSSGRILSGQHQANRQSYAGADVLSRIEYSMSHGYEKLHDTLIEQLDDMIAAAFVDASSAPGYLSRMVITGNTTMLHFLAGLDPRGIGAAPFTPQSLFGKSYTASDIGLSVPSGVDIYLPKCFGAYTGADLLCGLSLLDFAGGRSKSLLADIGTNGEMALELDGKLLCCAAPAGPAMEGANISMGMPALPGAIYSVAIKDGGIHLKTIDGKKAVGICGSGLISAAAFMAVNGIIDESGAIQGKGHDFTGHICEHSGEISFMLGGVIITQGDIRNLQLAKAAIAAGIDTLIHEAGISPSELEGFYISGGFGSYIDPAEAAAIGLIPGELLPIVKLPGNTALAGASEMLFSREERYKSEGLPRLCKEIRLSSSSFFMDSYIDNISFNS